MPRSTSERYYSKSVLEFSEFDRSILSTLNEDLFTGRDELSSMQQSPGMWLCFSASLLWVQWKWFWLSLRNTNRVWYGLSEWIIDWCQTRGIKSVHWKKRAPFRFLFSFETARRLFLNNTVPFLLDIYFDIFDQIYNVSSVGFFLVGLSLGCDFPVF